MSISFSSHVYKNEVGPRGQLSEKLLRSVSNDMPTIRKVYGNGYYKCITYNVYRGDNTYFLEVDTGYSGNISYNCTIIQSNGSLIYKEDIVSTDIKMFKEHFQSCIICTEDNCDPSCDYYKKYEIGTGDPPYFTKDILAKYTDDGIKKTFIEEFPEFQTLYTNYVAL